jgi:multicomponent Na+:H+ antiporter subunit E
MIKNQFSINILLAFAWILLTGDITAENFIEGLIIGYVILWISRSAYEAPKYFRKIPKAVGFFFYFLRELLIANLKVAYDVVTPTDYMNPGIVAFPLEAESDIEITLLANLITLTPGTLSLDVSSDKKVLYIHTLYLDDPEKFRSEIKNGMEKKLLEVLR